MVPHGGSNDIRIHQEAGKLFNVSFQAPFTSYSTCGFEGDGVSFICPATVWLGMESQLRREADGLAKLV
jgi:hypothetical protein